jgi:hypothetical protein
MPESSRRAGEISTQVISKLELLKRDDLTVEFEIEDDDEEYDEDDVKIFDELDELDILDRRR